MKSVKIWIISLYARLVRNREFLWKFNSKQGTLKFALDSSFFGTNMFFIADWFLAERFTFTAITYYCLALIPLHPHQACVSWSKQVHRSLVASRIVQVKLESMVSHPEFVIIASQFFHLTSIQHLQVAGGSDGSASEFGFCLAATSVFLIFSRFFILRIRIFSGTTILLF